MANALEHELLYAFGDTAPEPGTTMEVAPGVHWVRMKLPFALDHINLWLLRDRIEEEEGWTIVDCGVANDDTRAAWEQVFAKRLGGLPVLRVIVTHMHPDHVGLAHWLTERWNCRLWMSATDYNAACLASSNVGFGGDATAVYFARHGLTDPDAVAKIRARAGYYASMVPRVPPEFRRLMDGQTVRIGGHEWTCIAGYGHAPEHISLYCPALKALISGDMVLPRISTNVSVYNIEPEGNPLPMYLASLERFLPLPEDALVLPSHGKPFKGLHKRIAQIRAHHDERFSETLAACREAPKSAAELLPVLFKRSLDLHQTTFAMGEAIAHLHALWLDGALVRERDDDGIYRFRTA